MRECINDDGVNKNVCLEKIKYSFVFVCFPKALNLLLVFLRDPVWNGAKGV